MLKSKILKKLAPILLAIIMISSLTLSGYAAVQSQYTTAEDQNHTLIVKAGLQGYTLDSNSAYAGYFRQSYPTLRFDPKVSSSTIAYTELRLQISVRALKENSGEITSGTTEVVRYGTAISCQKLYDGADKVYYFAAEYKANPTSSTIHIDPPPINMGAF